MYGFRHDGKPICECGLTMSFFYNGDDGAKRYQCPDDHRIVKVSMRGVHEVMPPTVGVVSRPRRFLVTVLA